MTETIGGLGMSPLECLVVLGAVALVLVRWLPVRARWPLTLAASVIVVLSGLVLLEAGVRWTMAPVFVGALITLPFAAVPLLRQRAGRVTWRARWWLALPGSAACLGLIAAGPVAAWALPVPVFPEPSGRYAVGTSALQWTDPNRAETATAEPDDRRTVVVQLWYPAQQSPAAVERAPYMGRTEDEASTVLDSLAAHFGIPGFLLADVARAHERGVRRTGDRRR
ncbi:hypothetical protein SAMN05421810_102438 [Amycolatopsis arida]|uniref:Uncharacterized protein n=1 Tax=Amycolatopsis arida TaxID=587909 RepID=A0A1I5PYQ0_9PSEU|nr:hypothetical protein [Amycolatopsis arida]TDX98645.1 hypothetical protein CLV69_101438 [Amycolatopsis arida]SFP38811.1 hypothetical protein SAMN05421810_102438 [Amycolatopsis arida]